MIKRKGGKLGYEKFQWKPFSAKALKSMRESTHKINIWEGAVRSGKTISSIVRWMQYCRQVPGHYTLLMAGKTLDSLKRNILDVIISMVGPKNAEFKFGTREFIFFGRVIYTVGANDERSQEKIRGVTLGGAYCDEITLYPESFFRMLSTRLSKSGAKMFCTTNPDSPMHWVKTDYIDRQSDGVCRVFSFTIEDNPSLSEGYKAQLKKEFTGLWYDRFILGRWVQAEGSIYDMWEPKKHCVACADILKALGKPQFKNYVVGIDYGTSNPTAFLMIGFDDFDGPKYVVKEYYYRGGSSAGAGSTRQTLPQKTDSEYRLDLQAFIAGFPVTAIVLDPAAASFKVELRKHGIMTRDADNSVLDGIRFVGTQLMLEKLFVDICCANLSREMSAYVWDSKKQEKGIDEPKKENDHALDALRYALYTIFGKGPRGIIGGTNRR